LAVNEKGERAIQPFWMVEIAWYKVSLEFFLYERETCNCLGALLSAISACYRSSPPLTPPSQSHYHQHWSPS